MKHNNILAEDLMQNDWVLMYGLHGYNNNLNSNLHWYNRKMTIDWLQHLDNINKSYEELESHGIEINEPQVGDVKPIEITPEILILNGFELVYENDIILYHHKELQISIEAGINYKKFDDNRFYLRGVLHKLYYVHELQQALRISGNKGIANNFIIK